MIIIFISDEKQLDITMNFNPSALRNKDPILNVLKSLFKDDPKKVLMVAEGSGTHLHFFSQVFKNWQFHATDYEEPIVEQMRKNFADQVNDQNSNVQPPRVLNSGQISSWDQNCPEFENSTDIIYNCNMVHISPFATSEGLFYGAGKYLKPGSGRLVMYGPYAFDGVLEPESNRNFDQSLKSRDPSWGIRDFRDLNQLAEANHLKFEQKFAMPANNHVLVFSRPE